METLRIMRFICTYLDIFGQSIQLRINKQTKSKTLFGGVLSILMFLLLFTFFYYISQDVFYKTNPQISVEELINQNYSAINLDRYSFPISFALTNYGNFALYNPRYFTYSILLNYGLTTSENLIEEKLNWTNCTKDFFPQISESEYEYLHMNNYFCIENQNLTISGSWSSEYIKYIKFSISICNDREDCAPEQEILEFIAKNKLYWNLYYQNTIVNPQNYDSPISYSLVNYYKSLRADSSKIIEIYIRKQILKSEEGFLLQSKNIQESLSYDKDYFDDGSIDETRTLAEFSVQVSSRIYIYHRAYMKIQSALANVGGLSTVLKIIFLVFSYIFSVVYRNQILLNTILDFDVNFTNYSSDLKNQFSLKEFYDNKIIKIKNNRLKDNRKIINETALNLNQTQTINKLEFKNKNKIVQEDKSNHFLRKLGEKNINNIPHLKNIENFLKKTEDKSLSFSFLEIISAFLFCRYCRPKYLQHKRKLYDIAYKCLEEFLDLTYIIRKIDETEKLKMILLEPHQIALFNFISKQVISLDNEKMKNHEMTKLRNFYKNEDNLSKLLNEYKEKIRNDPVENIPNEIDSKLIKLLEIIK